MISKWDEEIKKLFKKGLGARKIAKRLGIGHHSKVSRRLLKLNLKRPAGSNQTKTDNGTLDIKFTIVNERLQKAAEDYLKFICRLCGYSTLKPDDDASFDLMVDFGNGYKKIQVKSSYCKSPSGNYIFSLARTRNNSTNSKKIVYTADEVDYFFLQDIEKNSWLIPFDKFNNFRTITPANRFPGYKINL